MMIERIFVESAVKDMVILAENNGAEAMLQALGEFLPVMITETPKNVLIGGVMIDGFALMRAIDRRLGRTT